MPETVIKRFKHVRQYTEDLVKNLSDADMTVQSMPDTSPTKWHLAHTTWFFETFILQVIVPDYAVYDANYSYLFNSYYESVGERQVRAQRGLMSRPNRDEIMAYRTYVDTAMCQLLAAQYGSHAELTYLFALGLQHEQQHQELLQTDIMHLFFQNPLLPSVRPSVLDVMPNIKELTDFQWIEFEDRDYLAGIDESVQKAQQDALSFNFSYDNESPQHRVVVNSFQIANHLVTNKEWLAFVEDNGYAQPLFWLSDGWNAVQHNKWQGPMYWVKREGQWFEYSIHGLKPLDLTAPVKHISYFEADAYASWARDQGKPVRLPTEYEWELAAAHSDQMNNAFGQVWQWTKSPYVAYPGFKIASGAVGEYNGKFMCNQFVLRGSSQLTSPGHARNSYRNFFYPHQRWQMTGLRLVRDK